MIATEEEWEFVVKTNDRHSGNLWGRQMITTEEEWEFMVKTTEEEWEFMVKTNDRHRGRMGIYDEDK